MFLFSINQNKIETMRSHYLVLKAIPHSPLAYSTYHSHQDSESLKNADVKKSITEENKNNLERPSERRLD
jgi:hypothetical protein